MYASVLDEMYKSMMSYGYSPQPPCAAEKLDIFRKQSREKLHFAIPDSYISFLTGQNGLAWNGLQVYACERTRVAGSSSSYVCGFIEENLDFRKREPLTKHVIFAEDGVALFTMRADTDTFEVLTSVGFSVLRIYNSFSELLLDALSGHI